MKKSIYVVALVFLLLAGCVNASPTSGDVAALEDRVEQLQERLDAMPPSAAADPPAGQESNDEAGDASEPRERALLPPAPEKGDGAAVQSKTTDSYDLAELETEAEGVGDQITKAIVTGDAQKDRAAFRELQNALEQVEAKVDRMEDSMEADVFSGALSRDDYRILDVRLDALEDRLDLMEDQLELLFGFDD